MPNPSSLPQIFPSPPFFKGGEGRVRGEYYSFKFLVSVKKQMLQYIHSYEDAHTGHASLCDDSPLLACVLLYRFSEDIEVEVVERRKAVVVEDLHVLFIFKVSQN